MKKLLVLGIAIALASAVYAFPTVLGATGGFAVPDCAVASGLSATIAAQGLGAGGEIPSTFVQYGVMEGLEVGAGIFNGGGVDDNGWSLNAKYVLPIDLAGIKLAAGAVYGNNEFNPTTNPMNVYLSGCYGLMEDVTLVGCAMYTDNDDATTDAQTALAAAIEKSYDNGVVGAEYALKDFGVVGASAGLNLYFTMAVNDAITARAAISNIMGNAAGSSFNLGLQYAFGK